jgi:hypothetical protein
MKRTTLLLAFGAWLAVVGSSNAQQPEQQTPEDRIRLLQAENKLLKANVEQLDKQIQALKDEIRSLKAGPDQAEAETLKKEIAALKKELVTLKKESKVQQATEPTAAEGIVKPVLDPPRSLVGLDRLDTNDPDAAKKLGFICKPLRIGSAGLVTGISVERIVDKTNMIAQIRFPKLDYIERATPTPGMPQDKRNYEPMPKTWQTDGDRVWIRGIDTSGLIDGQAIYVTAPVKIVDTIDAGGETIYLLKPSVAAKKPHR